MRIDKDKFYRGTCKKCRKIEHCLGRDMYSCARMRMFHSEEFEKHTGIKLEYRNK